jgi:hypothetical protein
MRYDTNAVGGRVPVRLGCSWSGKKGHQVLRFNGEPV